MSKGTQTTSTQSSANPQAMQSYYNLLNQAQTVAATPYQAYTGELTAPVNQQQQTGIGGINQYAQAAQPDLQTAAGYAQTAAQPLTQAQIQQYQSPYTQDVVQATEQQMNNQNAIQQQQVLGNAAAQGALGGDRTAVAQSVLAGQQSAQEAPVIAGLENQGYTTGLQTAEQQQQNMAQGAYNLGNVANSIQNAGLTGANAQVGAGTLEQQTQQAQDAAAYQQYEQALQYPFATLGWEAGIDTGVGSQMGGTSSTTAPPPNYTAQLLGAGIGAGAAVLSDKRMKENIRKIGKLFDGQNVYRFNYKGDPTTHVGLIAQEVEKSHPGAVHEFHHVKAVDLNKATKDAARRFGGRIQGLQTGGIPYGGGGDGSMPYSSGLGWVPTMSITKGGGAPKPPNATNQQQQSGVLSPSQMVVDAAKIAPSLNSGLSNMFGSSPTYGGGNILGGDVSGGSSASPAAGLDASDYGVGFRDGGLALPQHNRIILSRPVRAGLGMASFMPRRHFDSGGAADDDTVTFDDRFEKPPTPAALYAADSTGTANPLDNILKFQMYGQNSPYAPAQSDDVPLPKARPASADALPPEITQGSPAGAPQSGLGSALAFAGQDDGSRETTPSAAPDSVNAAPAQAVSAPATPSPRGFGLLGLLPQDVGLSALSAGLGMMSSRSPFLGVGIGEGGLQGLSTYSQLQQQHQAQQKQQQDVDLKVKQLNQQARSEQDRIALETKKEQFSETQMTPAQKAEADFRERNLQRENSQPVKIGIDMATGAEIYGVRDPNAPGGFRRIDLAQQQGTPQGTGAPVSSAEPTTTTPPAVPNSDDASLPDKSTPVSGDIPDNVKPEILAALDPNVASQVKALDEGRMAFPTGFALSKPYWQNMLRLVSQYDPSFDAVNYNARTKTRSDFVAGKSAQNITSFNTAIGHLDTLDKSIDGLGNTRFGWINPTLQSARSATGDTQFQAAQKQFMAAKQAVTDELTRAFRGSGGNVHDIVGWEQTLNQADSPAALHAATKAAIDLLRSRIESVGDQYNRGMGTTRDPLTLLSPHAQATVARLSGETALTPAIDPRDTAALKANANNPAAAAAIDKKYGQGTAARLLGAQ